MSKFAIKRSWLCLYTLVMLASGALLVCSPQIMLLPILLVLSGSIYFFKSRMVSTPKSCFECIATNSAIRHQLLLSEARFKTFLENTPSMAFIKDREGHYIYVNRTFLRILNKDAYDVIGKTDYEIFPEKVAQELRMHDAIVLEDQVSREFFEIKSNDEGLIDSRLLVFKFPVFQPDGQVFLGGIAIRDFVFELEKHQEMINREMQKHSFSAINSFIYGISHEMKSPLQAIDCANGILWEHSLGEIDISEQKRNELHTSIQNSIADMENIIKNILHFGGIGTGDSMGNIFEEILVDIKEGSIKDVVGQTVNTFLLMDEYKTFPVHISQEIDDELTAAFSGTALRRILINLLKNSVKAVEARLKEEGLGSDEGHIHISICESSLWIDILVEDNGRGIYPEAQKSLFNPFYRAYRDIRGTGLGLFISRSLALCANMDLTLKHSERGKTVFALRIPKDRDKD